MAKALKKTKGKENQVAVESVNINKIDEAKAAMENVDVAIPKQEDTEAEVTEAEESIQELGAKIEELDERQKEVFSKIEENPEKTEEILKEELEKAKKEVSNMEKKMSNSCFTNVWNGVTYC